MNEIASYGGLRQLAKNFDRQDICIILEYTLMEEKETDALLAQIAIDKINLVRTSDRSLVHAGDR